MSAHRYFDKICCVVLAFSLIVTVWFMNAERFGVQKASAVMGYEKKLFDSSAVHTIDIIMDDPDDFMAHCQTEEYYSCSVVIDKDVCKNVAIRGKGNTSLTQVASYGNNRYSFKIEFDHYDSTNSYYGLDKLCLNNIIQDNTYMKDYLTYQMMVHMGVAAPLCSYAYITINGEDHGLYLAVEGVEESFLRRNYGKNYGALYKPDSQSMSGGQPQDGDQTAKTQENDQSVLPPIGTQGNPPHGGDRQFDPPPNMDKQPDQPQNGSNQGGQPPAESSDAPTPPANFDPAADELPFAASDADGHTAFGGGANGSDDVLLKYIDDNADSYANIFDNAKTDVSDSDKTRLIAALKSLNSREDLGNTVDKEKVIRYFVVHNFVLNFDSYTGSMIHNYYLYEKDGQMQMIPWDYNLAFGGFESAGGAESLVNYPIDSPVSGGSVEDRPMIAWIFADEEYTALYHQYFSDFISEYFDSGYFVETVDGVYAAIAPYVEKDPTKFCTYEEFEAGVKTLKEFCLLRAESVSGQLSGTIDSPANTQNADTLVDVGDLNIADMGSMNRTFRGQSERSDEKQNGDMPLSQESSAATTPPANSDKDASNKDAPTSPAQEKGENVGGEVNGVFKNSNERGTAAEPAKGNDHGTTAEPTKDDERERTAANTLSSLPYLGISAGILALGLSFALLFKRRKSRSGKAGGKAQKSP